MRIGIDCQVINNPAGIGEYTRQSVKRIINNKQDFFVLFFADEQNISQYRRENVTIKILPLFKYKKYLPVIYSQLIVPLFMKWQKLDVAWWPANIIPLGYFGKSVVTIHDLAVYKLPELFPDQWFNFDRQILVPLTLKKASKIIAVSQCTKNDITELFKIPENKITVVYEGYESLELGDKGGEILDKYGLTAQKYFLFIGTIEPRKNLLQVIEAYKKFVQSTDPEINLVFAGKSGWKNEEIFVAIKNANQELGGERVKYLGYVSELEKAYLLNNCLVFVFPGLYEGFGLPALEAMASGVPVIVSNAGSLPEVVGEAGIIVESNNTNQLTEALKKMTADENFRQELIAKGLKKSREFSWDLSVSETLAVIKTVA